MMSKCSKAGDLLPKEPLVSQFAISGKQRGLESLASVSVPARHVLLAASQRLAHAISQRYGQAY